MLDLQVHKYEKKGDGGQAILSQVIPYIVIAHATEGGSQRVFIQGGKFYHEKGEEFKKQELPPWLPTELKKLSPRARKDAGLEPEPSKDD